MNLLNIMIRMKQFKYIYYWYFLLLCIIYIISFVIGIYYGKEDFYNFETMRLDITIPELGMSSSFDIFLSILRNNSIVSLVLFVSALFSLGIVPIFLIFYNGFIFGNVLGCCTHILSSSDIFFSTFPHFLEFIGLNIFGTLGFYISFEYIINKQMPKYSLSLLCIISGILIVLIMAFLESYISI